MILCVLGIVVAGKGKLERAPTPRELLGRKKKKRKKMAEFEKQLKERARELKTFFKKGVKIVGDSCKKGWYKVRHMRG